MILQFIFRIYGIANSISYPCVVHFPGFSRFPIQMVLAHPKVNLDLLGFREHPAQTRSQQPAISVEFDRLPSC